jgi:hypothetical protein
VPQFTDTVEPYRTVNHNNYGMQSSIKKGYLYSLHAHSKAVVGKVTRIYEVELNATGPV